MGRHEGPRQHPIASWLKQARVAALREEPVPEFRVRILDKRTGTSKKGRVGAIWVNGRKIWDARSGLQIPVSLDLSWPVPEGLPLYLSIASGGKKDAPSSGTAEQGQHRRTRKS